MPVETPQATSSPATSPHATTATPTAPADAEFAGATDVVNGKDMLGEYGKKEGVEFRWNTELVELMQDADGSVTGAICQGPDGYVHINASKGVVVCTGG